jgi:hypothetical protein
MLKLLQCFDVHYSFYCQDKYLMNNVDSWHLAVSYFEAVSVFGVHFTYNLHGERAMGVKTEEQIYRIDSCCVNDPE